MEAINPSRAEAAEETKPDDVNALNGGRQSKAVFEEPTLTDLSGPTFAKLRDLRIHAQEVRNQFAHLLNLGSSLE